jgi:hypothetical protein
MTVAAMEAFMVRKYRLDTTAQEGERVIRGHIERDKQDVVYEIRE